MQVKTTGKADFPLSPFNAKACVVDTEKSVGEYSVVSGELEAVAARVLGYRKREGLTQKALGTRAGLDKETINTVEAARPTSYRTWQKLAKVMNVGLHELTAPLTDSDLSRHGAELKIPLSKEGADGSIETRLLSLEQRVTALETETGKMRNLAEFFARAAVRGQQGRRAPQKKTGSGGRH